jgi:hypothetical protein
MDRARGPTYAIEALRRLRELCLACRLRGKPFVMFADDHGDGRVAA